MKINNLSKTRKSICSNCNRNNLINNFNNNQKNACSLFTITELNIAINKTKTTRSAAGEDGISNIMIKNLPTEWKYYLLSIINQAWTEGIWPSEWKKGTITPILKREKSRRPWIISTYLSIIMYWKNNGKNGQRTLSFYSGII